MLKIIVSIVALVAATVPATAKIVGNGVSLNRISLNGISLNGTSFDGISLNGISLNGAATNKIISDSIARSALTGGLRATAIELPAGAIK